MPKKSVGTKNKSGITEDFFTSYFSHKNDAYAIRFKDVRKLAEPKSINILENIECAPQSYRYIQEPLCDLNDKLGVM